MVSHISESVVLVHIWNLIQKHSARMGIKMGFSKVLRPMKVIDDMYK